MREVGFVKSVSGDFCEVIVKRATACGDNCASCSGTCCAKEQPCIAQNVIGAEAGDKVIIELDSGSVLKSAFYVYIVPILVFCTVFFIASVKTTQAISAILALFSMACVFFILHIADKKKKIYPKVIQIL